MTNITKQHFDNYDEAMEWIMEMNESITVGDIETTHTFNGLKSIIGNGEDAQFIATYGEPIKQ